MVHNHHHHTMPVTTDPLTLATFMTTLAFSFFASFHCAGMCAPLVYATLGEHAAIKRAGIWLYNFGRMISYVAAGAILGALHATISGMAAGLGKGLAMGLSVFLMVWALLHVFNRLTFTQNILPQKLKKIASRLSQRLMSLKPMYRAVGLGAVTVLLPCMTLTPAFAGAAATGSAFHGSLFMLAFFLGTVPAMLFAPAVPNALVRVIPLRFVQPMSAMFLFLTGLITFLRIYH